MLAEALEVFRDAAAFPVTTPPPQPDDKASKGNFVGMISRRNVAALLDAHGVEAAAIDLTSKVHREGVAALGRGRVDKGRAGACGWVWSRGLFGSC